MIPAAIVRAVEAELLQQAKQLICLFVQLFTGGTCLFHHRRILLRQQIYFTNGAIDLLHGNRLVLR